MKNYQRPKNISIDRVYEDAECIEDIFLKMEYLEMQERYKSDSDE